MGVGTPTPVPESSDKTVRTFAKCADTYQSVQRLSHAYTRQDAECLSHVQSCSIRSILDSHMLR